MSMIVISEAVMCCTDCGGFHFIDDGDGIVTHPTGDMYVVHDRENRTHRPCPNSGKRYAFPDEKPVEALELVEAL